MNLFIGCYWKTKWIDSDDNQPVVICSKLTIKTLEQGVKYVKS